MNIGVCKRLIHVRGRRSIIGRKGGIPSNTIKHVMKAGLPPTCKDSGTALYCRIFFFRLQVINIPSTRKYPGEEQISPTC